MLRAVPKPGPVKRRFRGRYPRPSKQYSAFIRRVFDRDLWQCRVPSCGKRRDLQCHHIVARSLGGRDEEDNGITLCAGHHNDVEEVRLRLLTVDGRVTFEAVATSHRRQGGALNARLV